MSCEHQRYDVVVIGGGPAGQKAAVTAGHAGKSVLLVEKSGVGGECVHRGTIPSKTFRESALYFAGLRRQTVGEQFELGPNTMVESLMGRLDDVLTGYSDCIKVEIERAGVEVRQGRARFLNPNKLEILAIGGTCSHVESDFVVIAAGSRPRKPPGIPIDHEHILDSDSLLSLIYLPESLTVLGGGVIASEFASVFQTLGVQVTMVDRGERPLGFVDPELVDRFLDIFQASGGRFIGNATVDEVGWDGIGSVVTRLSNGETLHTQKMLVAQGRTASVASLDADAAGLGITDRGFLRVDEFYRTDVPHIYAVGDVIGPPALAASSMNQGRRAVCHALGLELGAAPEDIPAGVYTIPEVSFTGITEQAARERYGDVYIGRADFESLARGRINGARSGLLKIVADPTGREILGVHIVGESAIELVHLGQLARMGGLEVDTFVDKIFNFPTFAEAYRIAALDIVDQRQGFLRKVG